MLLGLASHGKVLKQIFKSSSTLVAAMFTLHYQAAQLLQTMTSEFWSQSKAYNLTGKAYHLLTTAEEGFSKEKLPNSIVDIWNPTFTIDQYLLDICNYHDIHSDTRSLIAIAIWYKVVIIVYIQASKSPKDILVYGHPSTVTKLNFETMIIDGTSAPV